MNSTEKYTCLILDVYDTMHRRNEMKKFCEINDISNIQYLNK